MNVQDAPLLDGTTEPSRFLCGIIAGILESVLEIKVKVVSPGSTAWAAGPT